MFRIGRPSDGQVSSTPRPVATSRSTVSGSRAAGDSAAAMKTRAALAPTSPAMRVPSWSPLIRTPPCAVPLIETGPNR